MSPVGGGRAARRCLSDPSADRRSRTANPTLKTVLKLERGLRTSDGPCRVVPAHRRWTRPPGASRACTDRRQPRLPHRGKNPARRLPSTTGIHAKVPEVASVGTRDRPLTPRGGTVAAVGGRPATPDGAGSRRRQIPTKGGDAKGGDESESNQNHAAVRGSRAAAGAGAAASTIPPGYFGTYELAIDMEWIKSTWQSAREAVNNKLNPATGETFEDNRWTVVRRLSRRLAAAALLRATWRLAPDVATEGI